MRKTWTTALACAGIIALTGCESGSSGGQALLETDNQKASYGIGRDIGTNLQAASDSLDMDAFLRGMREVFDGVDPALPEQELNAAVTRFGQRVQEAARAEREAQGVENAAASEEFLAENAAREGVEVTESGLQYEVIEEGDGRTPSPGQEVTIHYEGTLPDGTVFDSSRERGEAATFNIGGVIPGFSEGLQLMSEGARYRLYIPSELAYGDRGAGQRIGPNQALIFEVEMIEVPDAGGDAGEGG